MTDNVERLRDLAGTLNVQQEDLFALLHDAADEIQHLRLRLEYLDGQLLKLRQILDELSTRPQGVTLSSGCVTALMTPTAAQLTVLYCARPPTRSSGCAPIC